MAKRQRLITVGLAGAILVVCALLVLMYQNGQKILPLFFSGGFPSVNYQFAIGGAGNASLAEPMGVDIAENGDIYVADTADGLVKVFDRSGKFLRQISGDGRLNLPTDLAVRGSNLYVVDSRRSRIDIFGLDGKFRRCLAGPELGEKIGAWIPTALSIAQNGEIYTTDVFYQRVLVFDPTGRFKRQFGLPGTGRGQLSYPNGVAVSPWGLVYVSDSNNNRIQVYTSAGKLIDTLKLDNQPIGLAMPRGIAAVDQDRLWVIETFAPAIRLIRVRTEDQPSAVVERTQQYGVRGAGDGQMNFPNDVAIRGNVLCVADRANNRVLVFEVSE